MPLSRADEKLLIALRRRKVRASEGLFLAEGIRVSEELLRTSIVLRLALVSTGLEDTPRGQALAERLESMGALRVTEPTLAKFATTDAPQGVLLVAEVPPAAPETLDTAVLVLALDGVQDPGNFGTLIRAADAFGVNVVCALPGCVDPWNPKVVRAAAGSSFRVPILSLSNEDAARRLAQLDFAILVADAAGVDVAERARARRTALVVGNEGAGVQPFWRDAAHAIVGVPTSGPVESLNVAMATGILLYELCRKDRGGNG